MSAMKKLRHSARMAGLTLGMMALLPRGAMAQDKAAEAEMGGQMLISTEGQGEVRVRPDSARVSVGVEVQAETLEKARNEVNTKMQAIIQALNRLRIPGLSLQTEMVQFYPIREERRNETPRIIGYRASNTVTATVLSAAQDDLAQHVGRIVDASLNAGANTVNGVSFFVHDLRPAQQKSLQDAVQDAEKNAQAMARAAGVKLGKLYSLEGSPGSGGGPLFRSFEAARVAPTPIETGETVITSRVTAKYTFRK